MNVVKKVLILMAFPVLITGCDLKEKILGDGGTSVQIEGDVSSIYYETLENVAVKFNGENITTTSANGHFSGKVKLQKGEEFKQSFLTFELAGYDFAIAKSEERDNKHVFEVKGNNEENRQQSWGDAFFSVGGKVVYHWSYPEQNIVSGETPLVGAEIYMNNHKVKTIDETGNFDLAYVVKGAVLSAKKEGFYFVDTNATPSNSFTVNEDSFGVTFRGIPNE